MAFTFKKGNKKSVTILDATGKELEKFEILDADKEEVEDADEDITDADLSKEEEGYVYDADEVKAVADMCKDMGYGTMKDMAEACKAYKDAESDSDVVDEDVEDEDKKKEKQDKKDEAKKKKDEAAKKLLDGLNGGDKKNGQKVIEDKKLADKKAEEAALETQKIVQAQYDAFSKPEKK